MRTIKTILVTATEKKEDQSFEQVQKDDLRSGLFTIGCHYLITRDGKVHKGRPNEEVGNFDTYYNEDSIIVRVCGLGWDFNEAQMDALMELERYLEEKYDAAVLEHLPIPEVKAKRKRK